MARGRKRFTRLELGILFAALFFAVGLGVSIWMLVADWLGNNALSPSSLRAAASLLGLSGLVAIACVLIARRQGSSRRNAGDKRWEVAVPDHLVLKLSDMVESGYIIELAEETGADGDRWYVQKAEVGRDGGLVIHIYANEHPPPHFHVRFAGEENSFTLDSCEPLHPNRHLQKHFKTIKRWHSRHRAELVEAWNSSRPASCPVGPVTL